MSCKENEMLCLNKLQWIGIEYEFIDKICSIDCKNSFIVMEEIDITRAKNLLSSELFMLESMYFFKC
jgi:hypothetical protein